VRHGHRQRFGEEQFIRQLLTAARPGLANSFALAGAWTIGQQSITAGSGAGIRLAFG
jgi:hypothetical protein